MVSLFLQFRAGIYNQGGTVIIDGSEVDDAIYALYAPYTGYHAVFEITNSIFDRNYISVSMENGDYSTSICTGSVFECTAPLKNGVDPITNHHFMLTDVTAFTLGGDVDAPNNIKSAEIGIEGVYSTYTCEDNYFYKIGLTSHDAAILGGNSSGVTNTITAKDNFIENSTNGVWMSTDYDCDIETNKLTTCAYGVDIESSTGHAISIDGNSFADCTNGVELYDVSETAVCDIVNNTFKGEFGSGGVPVNSTAIVVELSSFGYLGAYIYNNTIENYPNSIYAANLQCGDGSSPTIAENTVTYTFDKDNLGSVEFAGIAANGCDYIVVSENTVEWKNAPAIPYGYALTGYVMEGCVNSTLWKNTATKNGTGFYLYDDCTNTYMKCNTIVKSYPGVYINSGSIEYQQGDCSNPGDHYSLDNTWDGAYQDGTSPYYYKVDGNDLITPLIDWVYEGVNDYPEPSNNAIINAVPADLCPDDPCSSFMFANERQQSRFMDAVIMDTLQFASNANENRYKSIDYAFKTMKQDSSKISNTARAQFMEDKAEENIGLFNQVSDTLASGNITEAENINDVIVDTNLIESNLKTVNDIIILWKQSSVHTSTDSDTLGSIATQDPVYGGRGVYLARAALRLRIVDRTIGVSRYAAPAVITKSETNEEDECMVYPNPAADKAFVTLLKDVNFISAIKILDFTGREIQRFSGNNSNYIEINLSSLVTGIYTLHIKDNTGKNFVKQITVIR